MRLYLDSADTEAWAALMPSGVFYGITTNPLLADRAGWKYANADWDALFKKAAKLRARELHVQLYGPSSNYLHLAEHLKSVSNSCSVELVIKVPLIEEALPLVPQIKYLGPKVLMTACYDAKQALVARNLQADYLAPYLGRMADLGLDAEAQVRQMMEICAGSSCMLMAASLRSMDQLVALAAQGVPAATISAKLAEELLRDDNTIKAVEEFDKVSQ